MMFRQPGRDWRTSPLPFSLALRDTVSTGTSYTTTSGAVANQKFWNAQGFRGYGPRMTFPGAGMDGLGCGCGCDRGAGGSWVMLLLVGAAVYFLCRRNGWEEF